MTKNELMRLLDNFLNNPTTDNLREFQSSLSRPQCIIEQLTGQPWERGDCNKCPVSQQVEPIKELGEEYSSSQCCALAAGSSVITTRSFLPVILSSLLKFKAHLEILEEDS
jgi:hypothetical protein